MRAGGDQLKKNPESVGDSIKSRGGPDSARIVIVITGGFLALWEDIVHNIHIPSYLAQRGALMW